MVPKNIKGNNTKLCLSNKINEFVVSVTATLVGLMPQLGLGNIRNTFIFKIYYYVSLNLNFRKQKF